jgi:hypothetical protein
MSGKIKFSEVFNKVNVVLRSEKLKEYQTEEDFLDNVYQKYIFFCKSRNLAPGVKDNEKFANKFKTFLKDPVLITLFFNNYFSNDWNDTFVKFYILNNKPKEPKEKGIPEVKQEKK